MRLRQAYEYVLVEINKVKATTLLLDDFNYFWMKGTQQFVNKSYNVYGTNQQISDNLLALSSTKVYTPTEIYIPSGDYTTNLQIGTKYVILPSDYFHMLNCIVEFKKLNSEIKCEDSLDNYFVSNARHIDQNKFAGIVNNYYFQPSSKNPYYFINTHVSTESEPMIAIGKRNESPYIWDSTRGYRMELRCGKSKNEINKVYVDYLKVPRYIELTQDHIDSVVDNSPIIEFSDYVCSEIIKEVKTLVLENASDPRLQNIAVSESIASPQNITKK